MIKDILNSGYEFPFSLFELCESVDESVKHVFFLVMLTLNAYGRRLEEGWE